MRFGLNQTTDRIMTTWNDSLRFLRTTVTGLAVCLLAGCPAAGDCDRCDTLVVAATGEPGTLLPPLVTETVGRDISDLVFERLAALRTGASPVDPASFEPGLAERWEQVDSTSWRFTLRRGAVWGDDTPVTSDDVVFSFAAAIDTALGAPAAGALRHATVLADGPSRVMIRFSGVSPEQLFDATYHVRIIPRHVWDSIPRSRWAADTGVGRLTGSGAYRIAEWHRGQSLTLERKHGPSQFRRIVWRFAEDQDGALNLVLSGEADIIETAPGPDARARASRQTGLTLIPYPAATYGFLNFRLAGHDGTPHPVLADRTVRRALARAIDRRTLVSALAGPDAALPPGPMSRALWIWNDSIPTPPFDLEESARLLDSAGWRPGPDQVRSRHGQRLSVEILVPATSTVRKNLALGIQQMWKRVGVAATIAVVDFPVFQERSEQGRFDALIGAWLDEPSPRGLADQWTRPGFEVLNQGRYFNPAFDSLAARAIAASTPVLARRFWSTAIAILNDDAAAVFLYTPTNVAVASRQLHDVVIDPFSWLHEVSRWRKGPMPEDVQRAN